MQQKQAKQHAKKRTIDATINNIKRAETTNKEMQT